MFAKEGLEGVVAARTSISLVKGAEGTLSYRGYAVGELADHASFEEVVYLLWYGELPSGVQLDDFARRLGANRRVAENIRALFGAELKPMMPIDALRVAVSILGAQDPEADDNSEAANLNKGVRIVGQFPALVACHQRIRSGQVPIEPDPGLGYAANLLYMMFGRRASETHARALETAMILQADHGLNASTFAARVTAGTMADLHAALVAALAALKGPLHGGANRQVLEMLLGIGEKSKVKEFVERALKARRRLPGFGHRVYKRHDPRALHLKKTLEGLAQDRTSGKLIEVCLALEEQMARRKEIFPNLDLYLAPLYFVLGLPAEQFASAFACARVAGWIAHVIEQHLDNRLIRPLEEYIGPLARPFIPLSERS